MAKSKTKSETKAKNTIDDDFDYESYYELTEIGVPEEYNYWSEPDYKYFDARAFTVQTGRNKTLIDILIDKIYDSLNIPCPSCITARKKAGLNCIITNVLEAALSGKVVAFPRGKNNFSKKKKEKIAAGKNYKQRTIRPLPHYTYNLVKLVDALYEADILHLRMGSYNRTKKKGKYSRICATKKLLELYGSIKTELNEPTNITDKSTRWIYSFLREKVEKKKIPALIQLKDEDKKLIDYRMTRAIEKKEKFLKKYNQFLSTTEVKISLSSFINHYKPCIDLYNNLIETGFNNQYLSIRPTSNPIYLEYTSSSPLLGLSDDNYIVYKHLDCNLYRVFNNRSFKEGGRFYGAEYQSLNKDLRKHIEINGNITIEADFKAMHTRMLYHEKGMEYQEDPYLAISRVSQIRTSIKVMFQMMINALNPMRALNAFEKASREEKDLMNAICDQGIDHYTLMQLIEKAHPDIANYFNTGIGIELQYKDSLIAEGVMKYFLEKRIPCLCIHDSFIVEEQYRDELVEVMKREYKRVIGFEGVVEVG